LIRFKLNGQNVQTDAPTAEPLLQVLSNDFQMNGQKFGCGKAQGNPPNFHRGDK
jgi:aerobic-type carbon monoxide dehydrogenase small subunit (CoxS/CutS family)